MPHPRKWRKTFRKSIAELPEVRLPAAPKRLESGRKKSTKREGCGWEETTWTTQNTRGLANLLAHRQNAGFPMIGKLFSNGWKISPDFSNDWKNFSAVFQ
jgi:hypothetical protein